MRIDDQLKTFIFFRPFFSPSLNRSYSPIAAKERSMFNYCFHLLNFARSIILFPLLLSSPILEKKGAVSWS